MKSEPLRKIERPITPSVGAAGGTLVSLSRSAQTIQWELPSDILRSAGGILTGTLKAQPNGADSALQMVIGNLNNQYGYTDNIFGLAIGEYGTGKVNITIEQTNGLRIRHYNTDVITLDTGGNASFTGAITATSGTIGGWSIGAEALSGGDATLHSDGYLLLGSGDDVARIDATDGTYRLWIGDATASDAPFSVTKDGLLRARNVIVSGSIRSTVFDRDVVNTHAGTLVIAKSGGRIAADFTVGSTLIMETPPGGGWLFEDNDIVRVKAADASKDSWFTVTRTATLNEYSTTYAGGDNSVTYPAGSVATDYGPSGQGYLLLTADDTNGPFYSIRTHAGAPWSTETEVARFGNLNGTFGISSNTYGIGMGDYSGGNYLVYEPGGGFLLVAGGGAITIDETGIALEMGTSYADKATYQFKNDIGDLLGGVAGYYMPYNPPFNGYLEMKLFADSGYSDTTAKTLVQSTTNSYSLTSTVQLRAQGGKQVYTNITDLYIRTGSTEVLSISSDVTGAYGTIGFDLLLSADTRIGGGLYVGSTSTDPDDDTIVADGYLKALEVRLPEVTRLAEVFTGADATALWTRNAYYDGSNWRRLRDDQDACVAMLNASGYFGIYNATDSNNTAGSIITLTEHLRVADTGRVSLRQLNFASRSTLTIASDAITVTRSFHLVDTEGGAATDDLKTINGGAEGDILILMPANDAHTVVLKNNASGGNLKLARADFSMDGLWDAIVLISDGTNWYELSRSDNLA